MTSDRARSLPPGHYERVPLSDYIGCTDSAMIELPTLWNGQRTIPPVKRCINLEPAPGRPRRRGHRGVVPSDL